MAISKATVFNRALTKLGVQRISDPDEQTEPARALSVVYETLLRAELRKNPWTFAIARAQLAASSTAPAFGYTTAYPLPSDFIRVVQVGDFWDFAQIRDAVDEEISPYWIEGQQILCDETGALNLRYIRTRDDPSAWDSLFFEAFACALAREVAMPLTKGEGKVALMDRAYKEAMKEARRLNAIEVPPQALPDNSWLTARYT